MDRSSRDGYNSGVDIRGRPGFDVVGSPAELQAEVPGRPPKTTGTQSKCEEHKRTRSRCLTRSEARRSELGPWLGLAASETGSAPRESQSPEARHHRMASPEVGRLPTGRRAKLNGSLSL